MSAITDAFAAAAGQPASAIALVVVLAVCGVFVAMAANALLGLWEAHQEGALEGNQASQHAIRLGVLTVFLLVVLVAWG